MNVTLRTCASSHTVEWHSINWAKIHKRVRKLQIRIVKAVQSGQRGKVKALQWLLTHSFSGKALAVKRVTENQGKRTAGIDGEIWSTPKAKAKAIFRLRRQGYSPKALRRVYIPKRNGGQRPLDIPTMKDRAMQALYKLALDPVAETTADRNSYGFRLHRSAQDAIARCFISLSKKAAVQWVLEGDIQSCFNRISHDWLIRCVPMDRAILCKWLKAGYVEGQQLFPTEAGTPQGGVISPTLANMALDGLERELDTRFGYSDIARRKLKVKFVRYADDFIVTGITKELLTEEVQTVIERFLDSRGLKLSPEKTRITHISEGFDFLGVNIRKSKDKLMIKPTQSNVQTFLSKVRSTIKACIGMTQGKLIQILNPIIRGWVNYYKPWVSSKVFHRVDHEIFLSLWQWAKRRHQNKGLRWLRKKYFDAKARLNWYFGDKERSLYYASETKIERHIKIREEANPYSPDWEVYFEKRTYQQAVKDVSFGPKLRSLWLSQRGVCLHCIGRISQATGWHIHHLLPRVLGGKSTMSNLVLLHPNCHKQIHALKIRLDKPPKRLAKA